jgi:hypothetical protein
MVEYLSRRCESFYRLMKPTPMNILLKLDSSCITWRSLLLRRTLKIRRAVRLGPLGRWKEQVLALRTLSIMFRIRRMTVHNTGFLNLRQHVSPFFFFRFWRWRMSRKSVDSAKSCMVRTTPKIEFRIVEGQVSSRSAPTSIPDFFRQRHPFPYQLLHAFSKLCLSPAFVYDRMFLGKVLILSPGDAGGIASYINRCAAIFKNIKENKYFELILPPCISRGAHV